MCLRKTDSSRRQAIYNKTKDICHENIDTNVLGTIEIHCIFGVDWGIHSKNGDKSASCTVRRFSICFNYSDDSFIRTRLFPSDTSGLMSFPDYWISH